MKLHPNLSKRELEHWLREDNSVQLDRLWHHADETRKQYVGDEIYPRGLLEISNYCVRHCTYCGINQDCLSVHRYRMSEQEIIEAATEAVRRGYGTVVIQAGEDYRLTRALIARVVKTIKAATGLVVALSLGERSLATLREWKKHGADRYFLRFETSDPQLYDLIHPGRGNQPVGLSRRVDQLLVIRRLGYELGSGVMIGIPGQSYSSLAEDILLFRELDLDMIGVGPYIADPATVLGQGKIAIKSLGPDQVPANGLMTYKTIALARTVCPGANITSTTALATVETEHGRELGWQRGANIFMPNITPKFYREQYTIYPGKRAEDDLTAIHNQIQRLGRKFGIGVGSSKKGFFNF